MKKIKIVILMFLLVFTAIPLSKASAATSAITGPGETKTFFGDLGSEYSSIYFYSSGKGSTSSFYFYDKNMQLTFSNNTPNFTIGASSSTSSFKVRYVKVTLNPNSKIDYWGIGAGTTPRITDWEVYVDPTASPSPTPTTTPTATPVPTATPEPTPSATPVPTATVTPVPTATPSPTSTPEQPTGDRGLLTITFINGTEKEYDLPMSDVEAFVKWYDARDAGRGPGMYAIDKHTNNKGPFSKRKDYVVFDKILTFEVSEYTTK
ncbi:hypothetical protein [Paenibacillus sp. HW567]|uniref:hypothetical protein n=1 Tax=Paenibacillus sp. HW567 TaxID=1034769 RepID=UPI0003A274BF|nr:hypothetical protein [Paenibacillus sp. HW567]